MDSPEMIFLAKLLSIVKDHSNVLFCVVMVHIGQLVHF